MLNLSATQTVAPARYEFERLDITNLNESVRPFVEALISTKQVLYDWGWHNFLAYPTRFTFDNPPQGIWKIYKEGTKEEIHRDTWFNCDPDELHKALKSVSVGDWGPSAADTILRMECSGIAVDLINTREFGPADPAKFMQELRASIKQAA
jgi:hypothetical protein